MVASVFSIKICKARRLNQSENYWCFGLLCGVMHRSLSQSCYVVFLFLFPVLAHARFVDEEVIKVSYMGKRLPTLGAMLQFHVRNLLVL